VIDKERAAPDRRRLLRARWGKPVSARLRVGEKAFFRAYVLFLFLRGKAILPTASYFSLAGKVCKSALKGALPPLRIPTVFI